MLILCYIHMAQNIKGDINMEKYEKLHAISSALIYISSSSIDQDLANVLSYFGEQINDIAKEIKED